MPAVVAVAVEFIGAELFAFQIGATLIANSTLIGYAVTVGASVAYSSSQNAKLRNQQQSLRDQGRDIMARNPLAYQRAIYGQVPVSGTVFFMHTTGTKNEYLHAIVGLTGHECQELGTIYFEGSDGYEEVPLDGSGNATGKYAGYFTCLKHLGTPNQTVDSTLTAAAPAYWTANHRLRGQAYLYCRFVFSADLFPNGLPTVRCMVKGRKVLDPRVGISTKTCDMVAGNTHVGCTTAGLSAGMRVIGPGIIGGARITSIDGSGTFFTLDTAPLLTNAAVTLGFGVDAWSANSALCLADYLADWKFGRKISWHRINYSGLSAEANVCDEAVTLVDLSTEARYTTNGIVTAEQDATPDLIAAMAGRLIDAGGVWSILAGAYRTITAATFTDNELLGEFQVQARQSMRESFSGVRGTFISALNQWQPADFTAIKNATYTAQDGNIRRWKDVSYAFTTSNATAQRLAKIDLERGRQQIVIRCLMKLKAFQMQCGDTFALTRSVLGWTAKEFELLSWSLVPREDSSGGKTLAVAITAQETAAAVWDWSNGEETAIDLAPNTTLPNPQTVGTPTGLVLLSDSTTVIVQPDGTVQPRLKVVWDTPNDIHVEQGGEAEIEYKLSSDADSQYRLWLAVRGDMLQEYITDVKIGLQYHVRIRFKNQIQVRGAYCTPVLSAAIVGDATAPAAPTTLSAEAKPGYISLGWLPSTTNAVNEYAIHRSVTSAVAGFALLANVALTQYDDYTVTPGGTYWYKIYAVTASEVSSPALGPTGALIALNLAVGAAVPSAPTGPVTNSTFGTYDATDGSVFAFYEVDCAALPANALSQNILVRKSGSDGWIVAAQLKNTSLELLRLDDLSPGVAYETAAQAWSAAGGSAIVAGVSFTAATKTTEPDIVTAGACTKDSSAPGTKSDLSGILFGSRVSWTEVANKDIAYYEVKVVTTNNPASTTYSWYDFEDSTFGGVVRVPPGVGSVMMYNATLGTGYAFVRAVNLSGVACSTWFNVGRCDAIGSAVKALGDAALRGIGTTSTTVPSGDDSRITGAAQKASNLSDLASPSTARTNLGLGTVATQDASAMTAAITGATSTARLAALKVADSGASGPRDILCVWPSTEVKNLTGGAATETIDIDLTNFGFAAKPDAAFIQCSSDGGIVGVYDYDSASSTSTNARFEIRNVDGTNLPSGNHRFSILCMAY